jgi:5-methylcytosine-specific restriction protein A
MPTINKPQKKPYKRHITKDQYNHSSAVYYNNHRWKNLRNWYISNHPLCIDCMANGISTPAEHVHHLIPFMSGTTDNERWQLLLDPDNLVSLCKDCHHKRHNIMRAEKRLL